MPRFQAKGFKRDLAELFRVNPDQFGYPSGFACDIDIPQLLRFDMGLFKLILILPMRFPVFAFSSRAYHLPGALFTVGRMYNQKISH